IKEIGYESVPVEFPRGRHFNNDSIKLSGGDFATASAARLPPAPGRFSTITGRPSDAESGDAIARAMVSVVPPGEAPTRILIGLPVESSARVPCARAAGSQRGNRSLR